MTIAAAEPLPKQAYAWGFSLRKRPLLRRFLPECTVRFVHRPEAVPANATLLVWGSRELPPGAKRALRVVRLEDGFLRSVGLGADLVRPLSWVVDTRGIYYDPSAPSDLEVLLQTGEFDAELLARAARLRERIVAAGLTKYNTGTRAWQRPRGGKTVVLVAGQVERDAAMLRGAPAIRGNLALLHAVRQARPDAYLVYKPHPDVMAGLRAAGRGEDLAARSCDEILGDVSMAQLLGQVDEVHVLTSLTGFEALLRGLPVTTYGQPFYAGWGLTEDRCPVARRERRLTLDQLVAGTLLLYPRYVDLQGLPATAEQALEALQHWRAGTPRSSTLRDLLRTPMRMFLRRTVGR